MIPSGLRAVPVPARALAALLVLAAALASPACAPDVDLETSLEITDVTTGWFDTGIIDGMNKLVPTISLRLRHVGGQELRGSVQLNAIFRRVGEDEEWSSTFAPAVTRDLAPGEQTDTIVLQAEMGYTGEQPRAEMLMHQEFVDAEVSIFVRHTGARWVLLGVEPIERQLLTN